MLAVERQRPSADAHHPGRMIPDQPEASRMPEGTNVLTAESGSGGLGIACDPRPDLILLDVMMPEMDGYEVIQRLCARPGDPRHPGDLRDRPGQ